MTSLLGKLFGRKPDAPADPEALFAQATSALEKRDLRQAIELYDQVIAADPGRAEAHYKRANALKDSGQLEAAVAGYNKAIGLNPDYAYAYCNKGFAQHALGHLSEALASYDRAIALDPKDALSYYNRALLLQDLARWDEVVPAYDQAIAANPKFADAQYNRSLALLYTGQLESGWRAFEWRWKHAQRLRTGEARKFDQPLWLGEGSIKGLRLLIHSEQGLGDTIQFCRYATEAAARGAAVIVEAQPALLELLEPLEGVSEWVAKGEVLPPFDCHCPLMSLPLAFGTTLDTIPARPKYLKTDPAKVAQWQTQLGAKTQPRVGLVWSGNPNNFIDQRRSIRLADWIPHLPPEFQYFQLQTQVRDTDAAALDSSDIFSFDDDLLDFANTAALCECMDVVVSVDTSLAHLSGALGQRTWVLLSFNPDWRWLRDREDTPWYPGMKLYRQKAPGRWDEVFVRVADDLRRQLKTG
jgi:tetratricopeptide (TPR) repeat protein